MNWTALSRDLIEAGPSVLSKYLEKNGWIRVGGRPNLYDRYKPASDKGSAQSLLLPLDRSKADYSELMADLLGRLATSSPTTVVDLQRMLGNFGAPGDELKFRKDVPTIRGAVPWPTGHSLVNAAQEVLLAGAKSRLSRRPYYGQANGRFAHRFLNAVLMGQTEMGSYVVTAFAPSNEAFPDKAPKQQVPSLGIVGSYTGREIVESVVGGLEATLEAVEHHKATNSLSGFKDRVKNGVSREMVDSVRKIVEGSNGADISVEWSASADHLSDDKRLTLVRFEGSSAPVLRQASQQLASTEPAEYVTVTGWLSLVSRPRRGEMGIVRLRVVKGSRATTLQLRLNDIQFERAATAIAHEEQLTVAGRQEKEGNRYWLFDPVLSERDDTPSIEPGLF